MSHAVSLANLIAEVLAQAEQLRRDLHLHRLAASFEAQAFTAAVAQAIALLKKCGVVHRNLKQFRVDSVLVQASKPVCQKILALKDLTWGELHTQQQAPISAALGVRHLPWPSSDSSAPVFGKCAAIPHDSPTVITIGSFQPTCAHPQSLRGVAGSWQDLACCAEGAPPSGSAEEHVETYLSIACLGPPGVGKTHRVKEQLHESQRRLFSVTETHVASQGLLKDTVTLARLYRRYLSRS